MKIPLYIVPILFSFLWANSVLAVEYKPQAAEVVAVVDGDTFWLRLPDSDEDSNIEHVANLNERMMAGCSFMCLTSMTILLT